MRRELKAVALILILLGASCRNRESDPLPASEKVAKPRDAVRVVRGLLIASRGGFSFHPCDDRSEVWLIDRTGGDLAAAYQSLGSGPGSRMFVEMTAGVVAAPDSGAGSHYATALFVTELRRARPIGEGAGCDEPPAPYLFRASGNEPFWGLTVLADSIVLDEPQAPFRTAFRSSGPVRGGGGSIVYRASTPAPDKHTLTLTLTRQRCADSMSGAIYSFSARATLDVRAFVGCAREGDLWAGVP